MVILLIFPENAAQIKNGAAGETTPFGMQLAEIIPQWHPSGTG